MSDVQLSSVAKESHLWTIGKYIFAPYTAYALAVFSHRRDRVLLHFCAAKQQTPHNCQQLATPRFLAHRTASGPTLYGSFGRCDSFYPAPHASWPHTLSPVPQTKVVALQILYRN